jgi:heme oxygenase
MAEASLEACLREATKAAHRRLDHHPLLAALPSPGLTLEGYGRALAALHGAHGAIESVLAEFAPAALFPRRLPDLESDLAVLGLDPLPLTVAVPQPGDDAGLLGMLYVIEGSHLGGAVIAKRLAASLPAGAARAFFSGAEGGLRWQRFRAFAQSRIRPEGFESAARAAGDTFAFYRRHLDSCLERG